MQACPRCGRENPPPARFCTGCRRRLLRIPWIPVVLAVAIAAVLLTAVGRAVQLRTDPRPPLFPDVPAGELEHIQRPAGAWALL